MSISALIPDPAGRDSGNEIIILKNNTATSINLDGWSIKDKMASHDLSGEIRGYAEKRIRLPENAFGKVSLNNNGDTISLLDKSGAVRSEVSYTQSQVQRGEYIYFSSRQTAREISPTVQSRKPPAKEPISIEEEPTVPDQGNQPVSTKFEMGKDGSGTWLWLGLALIVAAIVATLIVINRPPPVDIEKLKASVSYCKAKMESLEPRLKSIGKGIDKKLDELKEKLEEIQDNINRTLNKDEYIQKHETDQLKVKVVSSKDLNTAQRAKKNLKGEVIAVLRDIESFLKNPDKSREAKNHQFINSELERFRDDFDDDQLTKAQRVSVITNEENNLVLAGAGTGKTKVVVARAAYLIKKGLASPETILVLAFTREAADELKERIKGKLGYDVEVRTFHSLGLDIIGKATNAKPSVMEAASNELSKNRLMYFLQQIAASGSEWKKIERFFIYHLVPYQDLFTFNSIPEYVEYIQQYELRTLNGERVKSHGELRIANFLFLNGVSYIYEGNYIHPTASASRRQYQPDFFLTQSKVYIEYLAIDKLGNTAPFINKAKYIRDLKWKRDTHSKNGTTLLELFCWQTQEGKLEENLEEALRSRKVTFRKLTPDAIIRHLKTAGIINPFCRLCCTFISLFKSNNLDWDTLRHRAGQIARDQGRSRYLAFLDAFELIYNQYQDLLDENNQVDFDDMIGAAIGHVESREYQPDYQHILVDEFQDISRGRTRLLKAIKKTSPNCTFFAVGDDWQAIYRFTGSDIGVMRNFTKEFGPTATTQLDKTFRFNNQILEFTTQFVMMNPAQIQKQITSHTNLMDPQVFISCTATKESRVALGCLESIAKKGEKASVLILGRYWHTEPEELDKWSKKFPKLQIKYQTIHASKGREADYVILLGLISGKWGFPCQMEDDPILDLVLPEKEGHENAEERRLFYVAVTRAMKQCFLVSSISDPWREGKMIPPSSFALEILNDGYNVELLDKGDFELKFCPKCKTGVLTPIKFKERTILGCSNYPYCSPEKWA